MSPRALLPELRAFGEALTSLPYFVAAAGGTLPAPSRLACARSLAVIAGALSHELGQSSEPARRLASARAAGRLAELRREMLRLDHDATPEHPEPAEHALEIANVLHEAAAEAPPRLLGHLVALELAHDLASGRASAPLAEPTEGDDDALAAEGAREAFTRLTALFRALHPLDDRRVAYAISTINPDAGYHTIPGDPREVHAALRAAERCLLALPYFDLRFGERGRRFTRSDSAWLASLVSGAEHSPGFVQRQIGWLGGVLAPRGIPRWTLEVHLRLLHEELGRALPDRASGYAVLLTCADDLTAWRRARVPDALVLAASPALLAAGPAEGVTLTEAPWLIASAIADELDGVAHARRGVVDWFVDPARFAPSFTLAVRAFEAALLAGASRPGGARP